jgi:OOP family OmpA-OmpF porin
MKLQIKLALIAVIALGCTAKTLPSESPLSVSPLQFGSGEARLPDQVVVLTDASGTMYQHQTFPQAKALTSTFVAAMPEGSSRGLKPGGYEAGLISFGGDERITAPLAAFDRAALASTVDSYRILGELGGYGGNTPYHDVIAEVRGSLTQRSANSAVVVFSDGIPDDEMAALRAARDLGLAYAGTVCIHTVQTGDDPLGADFLKRLSNVTGCGTTRSANSVSDPAAFMRFVREVFVTTTKAPEPDVCSGVIRLRGVEFEFDKADLTGASGVVLDAAIEGLLVCPNVPLRVEGHTDALGSNEYNQDLGLRRAESVRRYLVNGGVAARRVTARSYGETRPIATNDTDEGRQLNRRVELHAEQ